MSRLIQEARERIVQVRQQEVRFLVTREGKPVEGAVVQVRMKAHDYLFGAVCYQYGTYDSPRMNQRFTRLFTRLFNYTMVPYHWSWYEPERGVYREPYTSNLIRWADRQGLKKKLHALIWQDLIPGWISYQDDIKGLYEERITRLMEQHGDDFDFVDVVNEITVYDRYIGTPNDTPVAHWIRDFGQVNTVQFGTRLVRAIKPDAKLIYGDFNVRTDAYYDFLRQLRDADADIDLLGIQSHMHRDRWSMEETLAIMDRAAAFGWPLHFPECSILSGVPVGEINYQSDTENVWTDTEEGRHSQAEYARDFYTLVFSHPATEALSWFDFTDRRWLNAPSGVVTEDLQEKPVYDALDRLINEEWRTDAALCTNAQGLCGGRLFFGKYEVTVLYEGQEQRFQKELRRPSFYAGGGAPVMLRLEI